MGVGKTTFEFSNSSIAIDGGSTNISLTRDNQSYTNKLSHGYDDIYTYPAGVTDYTWSPTASQLTKFFEEVPSQKTRLIDVYLDTYNGSTKVGRDVHALNVTLLDDTGKPDISSFDITADGLVSTGISTTFIGDDNNLLSGTEEPWHSIEHLEYGCIDNGIVYNIYPVSNDFVTLLNEGSDHLNALRLSFDYSIDDGVIDYRDAAFNLALGFCPLMNEEGYWLNGTLDNEYKYMLSDRFPSYVEGTIDCISEKDFIDWVETNGIENTIGTNLDPFDGLKLALMGSSYCFSQDITISNVRLESGVVQHEEKFLFVRGLSNNFASNLVLNPKYGASISKISYTVTGINKEYSDITTLIGELPLTMDVEEYTINAIVTDSRNFSNSKQITLPFCRYEKPSVDFLEVIRCNADGTENEAGKKAKVIVKGSWSPIKQLSDNNTTATYYNSISLKVGYKTKDATSYSYQTVYNFSKTNTNIVDGTIDISQLLSATLTAGTDYVFSVQLTDEFDSYTKTGVGASNVNNILYVSADGKELVIGSDNGNNVLIDSDSVDIREGSTALSSFTKDSVSIGKNSQEATIDFCNNAYVMNVGADPYYGVQAANISTSTLPLIINGQGTDSRVDLFDHLSKLRTGSPEHHNLTVYSYDGTTKLQKWSDRRTELCMKCETWSDGTKQCEVMLLAGIYSNNYNSTDKTYSEVVTKETSVSLGVNPGTNTPYFTFDGKNVSVEGHTHSAANITSGTLPVGRGGTGKTSGTFYGETVLYNNSTGTTGQVTLSADVSSFTYIEIFYTYGNKYNTKYSSCHGSKKIQPKQGYYFFLTESFYANSNVMQTLSEACCLWSKSITRGTPCAYFNSGITSSNFGSGSNSGVAFYITRVVGLK